MAFKIQIASISHKDPTWLSAALLNYQQRLPREWQLEYITLKPKALPSRTLTQIKEEEWQRLSERILPGASIIALDEKGKQWSSTAFAQQLRDWQGQSQALAFVIGGAEGLAEQCLAAAKAVLSLSSLTFPHQFAKLILVEQLYRAFTIQSGHPYHKN